MGRRDMGENVSDLSQLNVWLKEDPLEMGHFFGFQMIQPYTKAPFTYLYIVTTSAISQ